jgi:hypothetical protein
MSIREEIIEHALAQPLEDRAFVVAALEESLPTSGSAGIESAAALLKELRRRSAAFRAGTTSARPTMEVLDEQRRKHSQEAGT